MDFVDRVSDFGAQEINVTGVASVERISKGWVRVTYFVARKGEKTVAVHLLWDCQLWLDMLHVWYEARESILQECLVSGCGTNDERLSAMN